VKCGKIHRTFPYAFSRGSGAFGGIFADISSAMADLATRRGVVRT
jgi:hypothetical protein